MRREPPTILVVDDSDVILQMLETILENEGYRPVLAVDGPKALSLARAEGPDAVLLDLRMPGMDGWEVLAALRADDRTRDTPVAIMTTADEKVGRPLAEQRAAQAYMVKPFSPSDLLDTLRRLLARTTSAPAPPDGL
jgi:two-component system alkaline phosphatase synthesis response regulator PhoP